MTELQIQETSREQEDGGTHHPVRSAQSILSAAILSAAIRGPVIRLADREDDCTRFLMTFPDDDEEAAAQIIGRVGVRFSIEACDPDALGFHRMIVAGPPADWDGCMSPGEVERHLEEIVREVQRTQQ